MQKTEIGNGWYEVIDTRKGDDVKPFYVNKKLRKVRGYFIFRATSRESRSFVDVHRNNGNGLRMYKNLRILHHHQHGIWMMLMVEEDRKVIEEVWRIWQVK